MSCSLDINQFNCFSDKTHKRIGQKPIRFLLWTGKPLIRPVVARGPFVMNTENQIAEAFEDYRIGLFGFIPA
jgi:redox-sensitive bicupin YhaK (pirin superfamily)